MNRVALMGTVILTVVAATSGCSLRDVRDFAVAQTAPPHTNALIRDIEETAEEIADEEQAERVEELSDEYQEFLRESQSDPDAEDEEERSIIMVDPDGQR